MSASDLLPLAVAVLIAIPALGSCIGVGMAAMKMLEGCARQPELMTDLQTKFFLAVHREIRGNKVVKRVYDFLAEAIPRELQRSALT